MRFHHLPGHDFAFFGSEIYHDGGISLLAEDVLYIIKPRDGKLSYAGVHLHPSFKESNDSLFDRAQKDVQGANIGRQNKSIIPLRPHLAVLGILVKYPLQAI